MKRTDAAKLMNEIKVLTREEAQGLPYDANWIGTLGGKGYRHYVKTQAQAMGWVKKVVKNWPGQWAVYENFHYRTGESTGWGATAE